MNIKFNFKMIKKKLHTNPNNGLRLLKEKKAVFTEKKNKICARIKIEIRLTINGDRKRNNPINKLIIIKMPYKYLATNYQRRNRQHCLKIKFDFHKTNN